MSAELETVWNARRKLALLALAACLVLMLPDMSHASEATAPAPPKIAAVPVAVMPKDDYCANIADLAADARHMLQMKTLEDIEKKIDQKIALLEAKRAESEAFLKKRNDAIKETRQDLVDIFSKMKPDVAAAQFEILDVETSASILKQLNARVAGTILNEMKAPVAAAITVKMAEPVSGVKLDGGT
ncbi:MAG: MotE family protein [Aestuariivirga sp.]|nr:MotE family protein [Aestuariivirga sp.]